MKRNHYFSSPSPLPLEFILDLISSSTRIIWIYHYSSFHFNWFEITFCNNDMKWSEIQLKIDFLLFCHFEKMIVANLYHFFMWIIFQIGYCILPLPLGMRHAINLSVCVCLSVCSLQTSVSGSVSQHQRVGSCMTASENTWNGKYAWQIRVSRSFDILIP